MDPFATPLSDSESSLAQHDRQSPSRETIGGWRLATCALLILAGIALGFVSLAIASNRFGNTDTIGLVLLGVAGWSFGTGISYLWTRFLHAAVIGVFVAPLTALALFVLFWLCLLTSLSPVTYDFYRDGIAGSMYE